MEDKKKKPSFFEKAAETFKGGFKTWNEQTTKPSVNTASTEFYETVRKKKRKPE